jgi:hypothetical protein
MEEDEEDYGALIYRESQLRKAEAAAAAAAETAKDAKSTKKDSTAASSSTASTRATSAVVRGKPVVKVAQRTGRSKRKRESSTDEDKMARKRAQWKKYRKTFSADGWSNPDI